MVKLKFSKLPGFRVLIQSDIATLNLLYNYAKTVTEVFEYNWRLKRQEKKEATVYHFQRGYDGLICYQGIAKLLIDHINLNYIILNDNDGDPVIEITPELAERFNCKDESKLITITQKWLDIYSNHPKGKSRAEAQIEDSLTITKSNCGIISLYTGL